MNMKEKLLRVSYLLLIVAAYFKFELFTFRYGLDSSWLEAINMFFHEGMLWGKNIIFTYGPLGFLLLPIPIGNNALLSLLFWIAAALLAIIMFWYILFKRRSYNNNILLSFILLYAGAFSIGMMPPEYALSYFTVILLSICWFDDKILPFIVAALICLISFFMKFNAGLSNIVTLIIFAGLIVLSRKNHWKSYLFIICMIPVAFCLCFMIYNPSIDELIAYVRGALEISSGYNSAMSAEYFKTSNIVICSMLFIFMLYIFSVFKVKHSVKYAMIFAVPVFMALKHGFLVRHWQFFLPSLYTYASIYVLFIDEELRVSVKVKKLCLAFVYIFFCATFIISALNITVIEGESIRAQIVRRAMVNPAVSLYDTIKTIPNYNKFSDERVVKLSDDFRQAIGNSTATTYPIEISYALDIPNYVNMPVLQAYSAYTPWLDDMNAEFFRDDLTAPRFIVFNMYAIDERFALIECPATWVEIFTHYKTAIRQGEDFLLERVDTKQFARGESISLEVAKNETVTLPEYDYCLMKLELPLSLIGKAAEILYRIPKLNMKVEFQDGRVITRRVVARVLSNETFINPLPVDSDSFEAVMSGDVEAGKIKSIHLEGPGLKYYAPSMKITFTEMIPLS